MSYVLMLMKMIMKKMMIMMNMMTKTKTFSFPVFCCTSAGFLFAILFLLSILGGSRRVFRAGGRNCDSFESFRCFRGGDVRGGNHIARSLPRQGTQMLVVLDYSNELDARLQTHGSTDAIEVVGLEVALDG